MCVRECVRVCVCERQCMYMFVSARERESVCVRERESVLECVCERQCMYMFVSARERECV